MQEPEFNQRVDEILLQIENAIDESGADIDFETAGGILTLTFDNASKIIINRQTPLRQIWVATRAGGFHFALDQQSGHWLEQDNGTELFSALSHHCSEQAGEAVSLNGDQ